MKQVTAVSRIESDCDDGDENDGKVMESDIISGINERHHEDQSPSSTLETAALQLGEQEAQLQSAAASASIRITSSRNALKYSVDDTPPWYLSLILGFQV